MSNWVQLADGRLINFDLVTKIIQVGASVVWTYGNTLTDRLDYGSPTLANSGLVGLKAVLQLKSLSLISITPNNSVAGGGAASSVIRGSGFTSDFASGSPTITIGGATGINKTFVDDGTIYLTFNTSVTPGAVNVVYTSLTGQVLTLVNGYTFN